MTEASAAEVSEESLEQLRRELEPPGANGHAPVDAQGRRLSARALAAMRRAVKGGIRRGIAWYVDPTAERLAAAQAERMRADVVAAMNADVVNAGVVAVNLELLKSEVRALQAALEDFGQAVAPTAGLAGAQQRMAELRDRINDLDRRTRRLRATVSPAVDASGEAAGAPGTPDTHHGSSGFDYVGFERRFRGDADAVLAVQMERYLHVLRGHTPVLDIGCGRGEFVGALAAAGVEARGVDLDADAVEEAQAAGRDVQLGDALQVLRDTPPGSLGAIVSFHVIEHLELNPLIELLELAASRLRPGGMFIAETPNPASLIVLGNSYVLDPTHVRPLHPALMVFLCERAGFHGVDLRFYAPAEGYRLKLIEGDGLPPWVAQLNRAFTSLNDVLFGPQEYAVVGRAAPEVAPE